MSSFTSAGVGFGLALNIHAATAATAGAANEVPSSSAQLPSGWSTGVTSGAPTSDSAGPKFEAGLICRSGSTPATLSVLGFAAVIGFADGSAVPRRLPGRVDRQPRRRTRTADRTTYSSAVGNHVTETARGRTPIGKIRRAHIRAHAAELVKAGVGTARRNVVAAVISRALADALADDLIPSNPCDGARRSGERRSDPKRFTVWTPAELRSLLDHAAGDRLEALWRLAVASGARRGELLGANWLGFLRRRGR